MTDKEKSWTEKGIEDSVEGKAKDLRGKIKDAAGNSLTSNDDTNGEVGHVCTEHQAFAHKGRRAAPEDG